MDDQKAQADGAEQVQETAEEVSQKFGEVERAAQQKAGEATQNVKAKVNEAAQEAKHRAGEVTDQVRAQAQEAAGRVQVEAEKGFERGKSRVVTQVQGVAQAFRKTGEQLRNEDQADLAGYTERIADQVEKVSGYLEGKDLRAVMGDVEGFARQRPGLFVGGALVVGLFAARFLRSSSAQVADTTPYDPYR